MRAGGMPDGMLDAKRLIGKRLRRTIMYGLNNENKAEEHPC